jgi:multicomponent Na+:H+ antiporter subunit C
MQLLFAITVGVIVACAFYLMLRRSLVRLIVGLAMLTYGVNLLIFSTSNPQTRGAPIIGATPVETMADPLPQALILTAIVISFGVLAFTVALGYRASQAVQSDDMDALQSTDIDLDEA